MIFFTGGGDRNQRLPIKDAYQYDLEYLYVNVDISGELW